MRPSITRSGIASAPQTTIPVEPYVRFIIRDCIRSIRRSLGPSALKDSFDVCALGTLVDESSDCRAFSFQDPAAAADALLIGSYFMLREVEMASACSEHLNMLLPVHQTASEGDLTRHLQRLEILQGCLDIPHPAFPDDRGKVLSKAAMIQAIRQYLAAAGVETTRPDEAGCAAQRVRRARLAGIRRAVSFPPGGAGRSDTVAGQVQLSFSEAILAKCASATSRE